jgi:hypothetical protein
MPQKDIKLKHVIFEPGGGKHLFFDISSTDIDAHLLSLYQCVEALNMEVL